MIKWIGKHSYYTEPIEFITWGDKSTGVYIGKFTSISINCVMILNDGNHHYNFGSTNPFDHAYFENKLNSNYPTRGDIHIGSDVWIGQDVTIMSGVNIGDGAVIAANSHVVKDIPPYTIYGGNPAKFIKNRFSPEIIDRFIKLKWWDYPDNLIKQALPLILQEPNLQILDKLDNIFKEEYKEKQNIPSIHHEVHKLYLELLDRPADWSGIYSYARSGMNIQQIRQTLLNSEEYKLRNNNDR